MTLPGQRPQMAYETRIEKDRVMISLNVEGMTCMGCVKSVEGALKKLDPAAKVEIDLASGKVDVDGALSFEAAREAIEASGFDVRG